MERTRKEQVYNHTLTEHHRIPESKGGSNVTPTGRNNTVWVKMIDHRAYHQLFQNLGPAAVAKILNDTWIDSDWELTAQPRRREPLR